MLLFNLVTKGLATLSMKEVISDIDIVVPVAAYKSSFTSNNSNTQLAAGSTASSSVLSVVSTKWPIAVKSIFSA